MGIKKFIEQVSATLGLDENREESQKKYLKLLLKKLNDRKREIKGVLKEDIKKKDLQEELEIISIQIKKGKKILHKLYNKE